MVVALLSFPIPGRCLTIGVIGDYGVAAQGRYDIQLSVTELVKSWNPDFILTVGDNNYPYGEASTIDTNIGQFYHEFIHPYVGSFGAGALSNRFFPSLGNHDWYDAFGALPTAYLDYFALPGNERYYQYRQGDVEIFCIDSEYWEPDGISSNSVQALWLKDALETSSALWKIVFMHWPPYSSGAVWGSTRILQWPFAEWGADVVLSGHDHLYERIITNGIPYFVNGLGGQNAYAFEPEPLPGSEARFNADSGALRIVVTSNEMSFAFFTRSNILVDTYTVARTNAPGLPIVLSHPAPQYVRQSSNAVFSVTARTFSPLRYQWLKDGVALASATNRTLTITNVQPADEGYYSVIVSNDVGSIESNSARLALLIRPGYAIHPLSQTVVERANVTLSVVATGALPITYFWCKDGVTRTNFTLNQHTCFFTLHNISTNLAGGWRAAVSNFAGPALFGTSANALLTVLTDADQDGAADVWEAANGFSTKDGSDGAQDADGDGSSNAEEFNAGTDPHDPSNVLHISRSIEPTGELGLCFEALSNRTYGVQQRRLGSPNWGYASEVVAVGSNRTVEVLLPVHAATNRLYRVITPRVPVSTD